MSNDQNDFLNDNKGSSPVKVILIIAVVLVIASVGYLLAGRAGGLAPVDGALQTQQSDLFDNTEAMNLPPLEEMVDGQLEGVNTPAQTDPSVPAPSSQGTTGLESGGQANETATQSATHVDVAAAMGPRGLGDPNAPIKLKEFFSLTCNHCANFHNITLPQIKQYIDSGEVYLEFHEFPLNAPALRASMIARCLPADKYYGYITLLFKTQDAWMTNADYMGVLRQNAKLAGMSDDQFDACVSNNELQTTIAQKIQEASAKWNIESTPTFVVNDGVETIKGAQPAYEFERVFRAVSGGTVAPLLKDQQQAQ